MSQLSGWREVGAGVYVCVAEPAAVTLGLVVGTETALVVDTGCSPDQGRQLRQAVAKITPLPVETVVATHWHYDHAFGLVAFDDVVTIGHESLRNRIAAAVADLDGEGVRIGRELGFDPAELGFPNRELAVAAAVDLGGRRVEIAHLGRGHTDGDLVVVVPDADLLFAGDLIESSGPPWFGFDSFPHEWAATLDGVIGLMTSGSTAIPGHGPEVNREFVFQARGEIAAVSGEIRRLVETGVAQDRALAAGSWPFPADHVAAGVSRGYAQLASHGLKGTRPTLPLTE